MNLKQGKKGILFYMFIKNLAKFFQHDKKNLFTPGWKDIASKEINQRYFKADFRFVQKEQDIYFPDIPIETEEQGYISEDIYPLR